MCVCVAGLYIFIRFSRVSLSLFQCLCGASTCRGRVTGNDWKIPALREKYNTHFYPHVQKKVDEYEATLKKETVEEKKEENPSK